MLTCYCRAEWRYVKFRFVKVKSQMNIYEAMEKSVSAGTVETVFIDLEQFLSILIFPFECRNLI